jgi:hypothetical protein
MNLTPDLAAVRDAIAGLNLGAMQIVITEAMLRNHGPATAAAYLRSMVQDVGGMR